MFFHASKFNQSLDNWIVASVIDMSRMFFGAIEFNQCILSWTEKTSSTVNTFDPTSKPTSEPICEDVSQFSSECPGWANREPSECIKLPTFMMFNCKKSCGVCNSICEDDFRYRSQCPVWANTKPSECTKNPSFMLFNCQKSCRVCYSSPTPTTQIVNTTNMLVKTSCPNWWTDLKGSPDPDIGPWCQGVKDGCVIGTLPPTASPEPCTNSDEFVCSSVLENPNKQRAKLCDSFLRVKNGKRIKVKNLCPENCVAENLCTCVDEAKKFTIKGKKGKEFTCAKLKKNSKNCKKKIESGFKVQAVCPNKCNHVKNCIN